MVKNDIYNNKYSYEKLIEDIKSVYLEKPKRKAKRKYYIKNPENTKYVNDLILYFDANELSYIRRKRLLQTFVFICNFTEKDLEQISERKDIDKIKAESNKAHKSKDSKIEFIKNIKVIWKHLFPEMDDKGRIIDTAPYVVSHLTRKIDKSKEEKRKDNVTPEEVRKLLGYFSSHDKRVACILALIYFEFPRPQELLFRKIKDLTLNDNYGKLEVSDHGKEGNKFVEIIESYPYITEHLNNHPVKDDPEAWLFMNTGDKYKHSQMRPENINIMIRNACKKLKINKPVSLYSFKRFGITHSLLNGEKSVDIRHKAGWTTEKQLSAYDNSEHEQSFKQRLIERGLEKAKKNARAKLETKVCLCGVRNKPDAEFCLSCKRPLDRERIMNAEKEKDEKINQLERQMKEQSEFMEQVKKAMAIIEKNAKK